MKALLYHALEQAPSSEVVDPEVTARFQAQFDEQWFQHCEKELVKINTFYNGEWWSWEVGFEPAVPCSWECSIRLILHSNVAFCLICRKVFRSN